MYAVSLRYVSRRSRLYKWALFFTWMLFYFDYKIIKERKQWLCTLAYCNKLDPRKMTHSKNCTVETKRSAQTWFDNPPVNAESWWYPKNSETFLPSSNSDKFGHVVPFSKTQERQKGGGGNDRQKRADKASPPRNVSWDNLYILER